MSDTVIPSGDDRRQRYAGGIRHTYRALSDDEKRTMDAIKDAGQAFQDIVGELMQSASRPGQLRSYMLAQTKVDEAVMWAVHGLTNPEPEVGE